MSTRCLSEAVKHEPFGHVLRFLLRAASHKLYWAILTGHDPVPYDNPRLHTTNCYDTSNRNFWGLPVPVLSFPWPWAWWDLRPAWLARGVHGSLKERLEVFHHGLRSWNANHEIITTWSWWPSGFPSHPEPGQSYWCPSVRQSASQPVRCSVIWSVSHPCSMQQTCSVPIVPLEFIRKRHMVYRNRKIARKKSGILLLTLKCRSSVYSPDHIYI